MNAHICNSRLKHDEHRCIALGLLLQMVSQCAGLVGFYGFGGFEEKLFDLKLLVHTCRTFL